MSIRLTRVEWEGTLVVTGQVLSYPTLRASPTILDLWGDPLAHHT